MRLRRHGESSISLGSGGVRIADVNVDISRNCRPDVIADVRWLPFISECFREVILSDVIEHVPSGTEPVALQEAYRILVRNGRMILSTPNNIAIFSFLDPSRWLSGHRHYNATTMLSLLTEAKFRVENTFSSGGIFAMIGVVWYSLVTWPAKKILRGSVPYSPNFLRRRETDEYFCWSSSKGYSLFVIAVKDTRLETTSHLFSTFQYGNLSSG